MNKESKTIYNAQHTQQLQTHITIIRNALLHGLCFHECESEAEEKYSVALRSLEEIAIALTLVEQHGNVNSLWHKLWRFLFCEYHMLNEPES